MRKMGVTETDFPEHERSVNLAQRLLHGESLLNYVRLAEDFSIQEMAVPNNWEGKTLRDVEIRRRYGVSIIAVRDVLTNRLNPVPDPDGPLKGSDNLLLAGSQGALERIAEVD